MKYYLIEGDLNEQALRDFIAFCNENKDIEKTVFLDSNGGYCAYSTAISSIINDDFARFTIIAVNTVKSSAAELFFSCICKRFVLPGTTALIHAAGRETRVLHNGIVPAEYEKFAIRELNEEIDQTAKFWESWGLSKKELSDFKKGKDILIGCRRLTEKKDWYYEEIAQK